MTRSHVEKKSANEATDRAVLAYVRRVGDVTPSELVDVFSEHKVRAAVGRLIDRDALLVGSDFRMRSA